jgi:hypothetical protein
MVLASCLSTMMTKISVISTFTTIQGSGKVEFGCDVATTTVRDIKERVANLACVPAEDQSIWWRGYILDDESLSLLHACRGVNMGETIENAGVESLVLYMTVPIETKYHRPSSPWLELRKPRLPSFDFTSK